MIDSALSLPLELGVLAKKEFVGSATQLSGKRTNRDLGTNNAAASIHLTFSIKMPRGVVASLGSNFDRQPCHANHQTQVGHIYRIGAPDGTSSASTEHTHESGKACRRQTPNAARSTSRARESVAEFTSKLSSCNRCHKR